MNSDKKQFPMALLKSLLFGGGVTAIVVLIQSQPSWAQALQLDRGRLADGQIWLLFTGHFTHWSLSHLFWDLLMFVGLGAIALCHNAKRFCQLIAVSSVVISVSVMLCCPEIEVYRGLSGLDSALFVYLVLLFIGQSLKVDNRKAVSIGIVFLGAIVIKTVFELISGRTLFVNSSDFVPLPVSHMAGMLSAILIVSYDWLKELSLSRITWLRTGRGVLPEPQRH